MADLKEMRNGSGELLGWRVWHTTARGAYMSERPYGPDQYEAAVTEHAHMERLEAMVAGSGITWAR